MRTAEDKYIADKLNSIDHLPEGYHPNMVAKWEMIEMGMDKKSNRRVLPMWTRIAAAVLVVLGFTYFLLVPNSTTTVTVAKKEEQKSLRDREQPVVTKTYTVPQVKSNIIDIAKTTAHSISLPTIRKETSPATQLVDTNTIPTGIVPMQEITVQKEVAIDSTAITVTEPTPKKIRPRYRQIDFGTNNNNNELKEKVASGASLQFKFSLKKDNEPSKAIKPSVLKISHPL